MGRIREPQDGEEGERGGEGAGDGTGEGDTEERGPRGWG